MKLETAIIKTLFFDMYGQQKYFSGDIEIPPYSISIPQTTFNPVSEQLIKDRVNDVFNVSDFSTKTQLNIPSCSITDNGHIWGLVGKNGRIFSLNSLLLEKEQFSLFMQEKIQKFEDNNTKINTLSFEDKVNIVAYKELITTASTQDWFELIKNFYDPLILKTELDFSLKSKYQNKIKLKI